MSRLIAIDCRKIEDFGIGTHLAGLLSGLLDAAGPERFVLLIKRGQQDLAPVDPRFTAAVCDAPGYSLRELWEVARAARQAGANLLHLPHYVTPFSSLPLVVTVHDLIHLQLGRRELPAGARVYARWMIGRAMRRADAIVTVSQTVERQIHQRYPRSIEKTVVVPNGVAAAWFDAGRTPAGHWSPPRNPYFIYVGNDKPHKNVEKLVEGFSSLHQRRPELRLVLAGAPFERLEGRAGLILAGMLPLDDLRSSVAHAVALVQPSRFEGFGLPVLEAMAAGTPVIISRAPALVETAGENAVVADEESPAAISNAMELLADDPKLRARLAAGGKERARQFTWRACAERMVTIWRRVLENRSR